MAVGQHFTLSEPSLAGNLQALIRMQRPELKVVIAAVGSQRWQY